jgi:alkaline phosphatase D
MREIDRRSLLKAFAGLAGTFAVTAHVEAAPEGPHGVGDGNFRFPQGVASGDPQPHGIVLWTRVEATDGSNTPIALRAQLSKTPDFKAIVVDQVLTVKQDSDHTLRLVVDGLDADTIYFYRFAAGGDHSRMGRTRTAPLPDAEGPARFAFVSCQSYEQAFYGAWARMLADDLAAPKDEQIDFVLFLGDFIYEVRGDRWDADMRNPSWLKAADGSLREVPQFPNGSPEWPSTDWNKNPGATNAVTLADYRFLYKLYLGDPHLQAARARWPFVSTWDDHEFSNDAWQSHDTYFDVGKPAQARKVAANQAWFEYIPALLTGAPSPEDVANEAHDFQFAAVKDAPYSGPAQDWIDSGTDGRTALETMKIYRTLRWGKTVELIITDNRSYKSPSPRPPKIPGQSLPAIEMVKLLDLGRDADGGRPPALIPDTNQANPRRNAPRGSMLGPRQKAWFKRVLKASDARWKIWANSMPMLPLRLDLSSLPFTSMKDSYLGIDGWNGYPSERAELLRFIRDNGVTNVVSCAGDHHFHAAGTLVIDPDAQRSEASAVEFLGAGISSETLFPIVERASRDNSVFHSICTFEGSEGPVENWNLALLGGAMTALVRSWTWGFVADAFWNAAINPGLKYVDSNSNGYGLLRADAGRVQARLVTIANPTVDYGPSGAPILRTADFTVRAWKSGEAPQVYGPVFTGRPAFPFA